MGPECLIDTNIIIAYFNETLPDKGNAFLDNAVPSISMITRIELLGWHQITLEEIAKISSFITAVTVYPLSELIVLKTIEIKQVNKVKTPDAIIAATALVHGLTLATRNVSDFRQIVGLKLINPFEL